MFSKEPRCRYGQPQLAEVICQLRFPEILTIQTAAPAVFQEAIRAQFPLYLRRQEIPAPAVSANAALLKQEPVINHQFATPDGIWRVNLTSKFISLTCSHYTCWEEFAAHLDKPLAAFIQVYKPAPFERVGLRYLNFISRYQLGLEGISFCFLSFLFHLPFEFCRLLCNSPPLTFFSFLAMPRSLQDLGSLSKDCTLATAKKAQNPKHLTTRELPSLRY